MIESFTVKNFFSYRTTQTLSFVASKKEVDRDPILKDAWYTLKDGKRILKLVTLIGDNGAGKSKIISALDYLKYIVVTKQERPTENLPFFPFMLDQNSRSENTELSIRYYIQDEQYEYSVSLNSERIEKEELRHIAGRNSAYVYLRENNKDTGKIDVTFGNACDLAREDQKNLSLNQWSNSSLLSVFKSLNMESRVLRKNFEYFQNRISLVKFSDKTLAEKLSTGDSLRDHVMHKLMRHLFHDLTTNIIDYRVSDVDLGFLKDESLSPEMLKFFLSKFPSGKQKVLEFIHRTSEGNFEISSNHESEGTINIVRLMILIFDIVIERKTSMVDEFGHGIDSKALAFLFKTYLSLAEDSQLIVATQNHSLLDASFMRRDSIRRISKNANGESVIESIDQSSLHRNKSLYNWYTAETNKMLASKLSDDSVYREYYDILSFYFSSKMRF